MGYLVNHPAGLSGSQGIGFDYVLGSGGLYVQSESASLTARVLVAPAQVRGLAPVSQKLELAHGPIPAHVFELGLGWMLAAPDTERFFAVGWDGDAYRLVVPPQEGTVRPSPTSRPTASSPSSTPTPRHRAFFSATDDGDEQGFRVYGVVGRLDTPCARIDPAVRNLRPLRSAPLVPGLRRLAARCPAGGQLAGTETKAT